MKIIAFNSSPRMERGSTSILVDQFLKGAMESGAETEKIFLAKKNIKHCLGCLKCQYLHPGRCSINDDMQILSKKFINADVVILATPIYVDDMNGIMKSFIDRLYVLVEAEIVRGPDGFKRITKYKFPNIVLISGCGLPEKGPFQVMKKYCKRMMISWSNIVLAQIFISAANYLLYAPQEVRNNVNECLKYMRKAGNEIVSFSKLSKTTNNKLKKSIVSPQYFLKKNNEILRNIKK